MQTSVLSRVPYQFDISAVETFQRHVDAQFDFIKEHDAEARGSLVAAEDPECRGMIFLVEPRDRPANEVTLRAWVYYLAKHKFAVGITRSEANAAQVERLVEVFGGKIAIVDIPWGDLPHPMYSMLMTDANFWRSLPHNNILIVQNDTWPISDFGFEADRPADDMHNWLQYDYVGAPWVYSHPMSDVPYAPGRPSMSGIADIQGVQELWPELVGNGGLSFRHRDAMEAVCVAFHLPKYLSKSEAAKPLACISYGEDGKPSEKQVLINNEDVFFCVGLKRLGFKIAPRLAAQMFACEQLAPLSLTVGADAKRPPVMGVHQIYSYMTRGLVDEIMKRSTVGQRLPDLPFPKLHIPPLAVAPGGSSDGDGGGGGGGGGGGAAGGGGGGGDPTQSKKKTT